LLNVVLHDQLPEDKAESPANPIALEE